MAKIISFANQKGGTGKSTLAVNLAVFEVLAGRRVLLVDCDPQSTAADFSAVREEHLPSFETISILTPTLHRDLRRLAEPYDVVVVDTGGRNTKIARSAVAASDLVVIPTQASAADLWAVETTLELLGEVAAIKEVEARAVLSMADSRTTFTNEAASALTETLEPTSATLCETRIAARIAWRRSLAEGLGVVEFESNGKAAAELRSLVEELRA